MYRLGYYENEVVGQNATDVGFQTVESHLETTLTTKHHQTTCISFEYNFNIINAFLFSLESQTTIGYGSRHPEDRFNHCWPIILIQTFQPIARMIFEKAFLSLLIYKKLTDHSRTRIRYFVSKCCLSLQTTKQQKSQIVSKPKVGKLTFRSIQINNSPDLVSVNVEAKLLKTRQTKEGNLINLEERILKLENYDLVTFSKLPCDLVHRIDECSPLFYLIDNHQSNKMNDTKKDHEQLEIILTLTGTISSTGGVYQTTQSFISDDILWNYKFKKCVFKNYEIGSYEVREENFLQVEEASKIPQDASSLLSLFE